MTDNNKKTIFTLTGPSCSGKTTLMRRLLTTGKFCEVVSFTSRAPRHGEVHGVDYYFLDAKLCEKLHATGETAEAIKFKDNWYGITKAEINLKLLSEAMPIVIVEPNGFKQLSSIYNCFSIYVDADLELLYTRFLDRFRHNPTADINYEARRIASIYLEQTKWPSMMGEVSLQVKRFTEETQDEVVATILNKLEQ